MIGLKRCTAQLTASKHKHPHPPTHTHTQRERERERERERGREQTHTAQLTADKGRRNQLSGCAFGRGLVKSSQRESVQAALGDGMWSSQVKSKGERGVQAALGDGAHAIVVEAQIGADRGVQSGLRVKHLPHLTQSSRSCMCRQGEECSARHAVNNMHIQQQHDIHKLVHVPSGRRAQCTACSQQHAHTTTT
jgi:hypothetical protein